MAQTFDTSRVGGGTYELEQDANGNYKLKSVGFAQVNKLNLPDLATSDTTSVADTTKKATEDTIKAQTTEVFKPTNMYQGGGEDARTFQDYERIVPKEAKVNEATVRSAGETIKSDMPQGSPNQLSKDKARAEANVELGLEPQNQYRSESAKFKERFDPTKIQAAPERVTGLQKVKSKATGLKADIANIVSKSPTVRVITGAAKVLGAVIGGMLPEETNIQKMNKSYFNVRSDDSTGQRIAGNPATDLYAGMNRNSAFGNLETAGAKRIARREKTAATKNVSDKFKADTERMKEQQKDYKAQKTATQKATQGPAGGATTGGGGGGSDSGRVICTDLHRTGELSTRDWVRDTKFTFKTLSKTHVKGYLLWAEPTVKHMQKYPRYRKIWKHIAQHRANDIAWRLNEGKFDLLGRIYAGIGEPVCWMLGNFVSDKQISKYNLTHWRRA